MTRIPFAEVEQTLADVLRNLGFAAERALACARLFAETTRDGVYTHGINRFPLPVAELRGRSQHLPQQALRLLLLHRSYASYPARRTGYKSTARTTWEPNLLSVASCRKRQPRFIGLGWRETGAATTEIPRQARNDTPRQGDGPKRSAFLGVHPRFRI